jgi:apolipoprotein N-acyltransferase
MAMSRLRSIEHGRSTVIVATSGRSALIRPDGSVVAQSDLYTPDALVASLPLRSSRTPADVLGAGPEYVLLGFGLLVPGGAALLARRRRHDGRGDAVRPSQQAGSR